MFNSKILKNAVVVATVAMLAAGGVWASEAAKKRKGAAGLMWAIPAKSLFCVRINKFDATLGSAGEFLKGVAPESFDARSAVTSKLGKLLGDERLRGVNKKGNIAIFGLNVQGESPDRGPMANLFMGALIPITKYENFISRNPNCGQADEQGISTITVDGKPKALVTNFRRFALLCRPDARDKLIKVRKLLTQRKRSLGRSLDPDDRKQAAGSPIWLYLNVKQGSQLIQPLVFGWLEQIKAELKKAKKSGEGPPMPMDPSGIISFYSGMLKIVLEGTDYMTVTAAPTAQVCNVTLGAKPVPNTTMAAMVGEAIEGDFGNELGYLEDGALLNIGSKIDPEGMKTAYAKLFELIGKMMPEVLGEADVEQLKVLMTKGMGAIGDSMVISIGIGGEDSSLFSAKYVIEVEDAEAFGQMLEQELRMVEAGGPLARLYKSIGMEVDVEVERDAETYKGIGIDAAKVQFKMGDEKAPESQMLRKMFGDGLDYRWAFVGGNCVYTIGREADKNLRGLIDQLKAGGPTETGSEMKAALEAIANSGQADVVGTLNVVRYLRMASDFIAAACDVKFPPLNVATESNVAFAGRTTADGKVAFQLAMPKQHLLEIKSAGEIFDRQMKEMKKLQKQKQKAQSEQK
ncbi:MAG: hypothetical protein CEE38_12380 [Planctomycetes bacterium B3_Pla]|nr:MAG: hypothetical protein CEE38_12380 [Planctomycetes bacterium B3_Pla]